MFAHIAESALDLSKCVPVDVTKCMTSVMGMFKNFAPGFGFGGSAGTGGAAASAGAGLLGRRLAAHSARR